jgi:hypothetical protein
MKLIISTLTGCIATFALPVSAGGITNTIMDTTSITVQGAALQMTRVGSGTVNGMTYVGDSATQGQVFNVGTSGSPTENTGFVGPVELYGDVTIQYAGTAGTVGIAGTAMAPDLKQMTYDTDGTSLSQITAVAGSSAPTITIGSDAQGITAVAQRSMSLTVFD